MKPAAGSRFGGLAGLRFLRETEGLGMKRVVLLAAVSVGALCAPAAFASHLKAPSCALVTSAKLARVLGVSITSESNLTPYIPDQKTCSYSTATVPQDVTIVYTTKAGKNVFTIEKSEAGKSAKAVAGVGGGAFIFIRPTGQGDGLEVGSQFPTNGPDAEVDMLLGTVEIRINAYAPLARVEALAKTVAGSL
jgi:hypothetical protein